MKYRADYANMFKLGMMFGKDIAPNSEIASMSVISADDILYAIKKAYLDMSPRTFKDLDSLNQKLEINKDFKEVLFKKLAIEFASYIENGVSNFDEWHHDTCLLFNINIYTY